VSSALVAWQVPLRLAGGAALVYLGVRAMRSGPAEPAARETSAELGAVGLYVSSVGLTLTNPMTIIAFGAVFASAGLVAQPGFAAAAIATAGVALGSLSWWLALVSAVSVARASVGGRILSAVNGVSGFVVAAFGVAAIVSVLVT